MQNLKCLQPYRNDMFSKFASLFEMKIQVHYQYRDFLCLSTVEMYLRCTRHEVEAGMTILCALQEESIREESVLRNLLFAIVLHVLQCTKFSVGFNLH
jgi:hypothetical protein